MGRPRATRRWSAVTEAFLEMMAAERGAARNTLEAYGRDLGDAEAWLAARGRPLAHARNDDQRA